MKKKFAALLAALMAICSLAALAACDSGEATVNYSLSEDGTYYIVSGVSGSRRKFGAVEVPATYGEEGKELPVKAIADEAFRECTNLYSVTLPEGIESIGVRAFMYCAFRTFTIPQTVTSIGYAAFGMCKSLTEITIPASVTNLEAYAFAYCTSLTKAVVKAQIQDLPYRVFAGSSQSVGSNVFTDSSLTELYLSSSIQSINEYAIEGVTVSTFHIYYQGTEEEWQKVKLYVRTATDNKDESGNTIYEDTELDKSTTLSGMEITFNAQF